MKFSESEIFFWNFTFKKRENPALWMNDQRIVFIFSLSLQRWGQMTIWPIFTSQRWGHGPGAPPPPAAASELDRKKV